MYDWGGRFLNYDCDPPKSNLYFDRNNNGIPDDIEDDAIRIIPMCQLLSSPASDNLRQDGQDREMGWKMLCHPNLPFRYQFRMDQE